MKKARSRMGPKAILPGIGIAAGMFGCWFLVRTFVFSAYTLPSGSMEKTIHVGQMALVNKLNYRPISRGDIVVFHFPEGDTVINLPEFQSMQPYYDVIRELGHGNADSGRQIVLANPDQYPLAILPIYKKVVYLKRCMAMPGDQFEIRNEQVYIDGRLQAWPPEAETYFNVVTRGQPLDEDIMKNEYGVDMSNTDQFRSTGNAAAYVMLLTWKAHEKMSADGFAKQISPEIDSSAAGVFPYDEGHRWTRDNYGPVWIPKKGASLQLTALNYPLYERVIRTYEGNKLEMRDGKIYINDQQENSYTFKMNYYWVIGDNLHESQDSRYWGFVPEDHLVGKVAKVL